MQQVPATIQGLDQSQVIVEQTEDIASMIISLTEPAQQVFLKSAGMNEEQVTISFPSSQTTVEYVLSCPSTFGNWSHEFLVEDAFVKVKSCWLT